MTAFQAFTHGWTATARSKAAIVLMWLLYASIAKIAAAPALLWLITPLSHSRMADRLLSHFDVSWMAELLPSAGPAITALSAVGAFAAMFTWLVAILFAGGVLTMLDERWPRFSLSLFLAAAGSNFWRILRLSLFGLVCYGLVWLFARSPVFLAGRLFGKGMLGWPLSVAGVVSSVLMVLLFGWVATVLDYAKVRMVNDDARGAFKVLLQSFVFVWRHFLTIMSVWMMNAALFALLGLAYLQLSNAVNATTPAMIALLIAVQQVFILFRTAMRVAGWGAALVIYEALKLPPFEPGMVPAWGGGAPRQRRAGASAKPEPSEWEGYGI